jgi:glycosyltransferase involved in cell wall biosynthesis
VLLLYSRLFEFDISRLTMVLAQVQTAVPDLAILLVGAGLYAEDAAALRRQLAQAELLDRVVDVGWVAPEKLPALLACADVGLYLMDDNLLNRTKCPVKLIDMVAVGVPVVAEAVGQVTEYVVNGRTGLLRSSGDAAGVAQDAAGLLLAPARRAHLGAAARAHAAAHFSWDAIATRLERAYASG